MNVKNRQSIDFTLLITVMILLAIGVSMVFSASSVSSFMTYNDRYHYLKTQGFYAILGIAAMFFMMRFDYRKMGKMAGILVIVSIILLVIVLIPGLGHGAKGAIRWIKIGPVSLQPSEFAKFALIIFLARSLSNKKEKVKTFKHGILPYLLIMGIYFVLIILEPNLSMAGSIVMITFAMLFAGGARLLYLLGWVPVLVPVVVGIVFANDYMMSRVVAFLNPWSDPLGKGYQAIQSLYALGSGGIFGLGLGNSRQKFFYIPEPQNDFIFSIIGEELGFIGTAAIIILFLLLIWRGLRIALSCPEAFGCLLATGITCMVGIQVALNIAVATASIPTTGISLPFISSGGSSLVFVMANMGILLNISKTVKVNGG